MIAIGWILFALLALSWTGAAWLAAAAARWVAQAFASGDAAQAGHDAAALALPEWLTPWIDPGWLQAFRSALAWVVESADAVLPLAAPAVGWLVPVVWILWGGGMILLLAGAVGAHVVVRRVVRRRSGGAA